MTKRAPRMSAAELERTLLRAGRMTARPDPRAVERALARLQAVAADGARGARAGRWRAAATLGSPNRAAPRGPARPDIAPPQRTGFLGVAWWLGAGFVLGLVGTGTAVVLTSVSRSCAPHIAPNLSQGALSAGKANRPDSLPQRRQGAGSAVPSRGATPSSLSSRWGWVETAPLASSLGREATGSTGGT
jgi:hypothetical protein